MSLYSQIVEHVVTVFEVVGAGVMTIGGAIVLLEHAVPVWQRRLTESGYRRLRASLGRVLLVGLETLVIADIVRTIAVENSLTSVAILGAIVLIRTVLSFSLDVEIDGVLPWRRGEQDYESRGAA